MKRKLGILNKLKNFINSKLLFNPRGRKLKNQLYIYLKKYRSVSESLVYSSEIINFLESPKLFHNFKRNSHYMGVVETVKKKEGYEQVAKYFF